MQLSPLAAEFYPASSYQSAHAVEEELVAELCELERVDAWLSLMADLEEEDEFEGEMFEFDDPTAE